jgi:hypothetical protein
MTSPVARQSSSHVARAKIMSDAFSAIMIVGAFVLLPTNVGIIDASTTRSASSASQSVDVEKSFWVGVSAEIYLGFCRRTRERDRKTHCS